MLALLQRDGRFVDFLEEDVSSYPDGQLGAAVRSIHNSCRQVLDRYIKLEPVFSSEEDHPVTVPVGYIADQFDSCRIEARGTADPRSAAIPTGLFDTYARTTLIGPFTPNFEKDGALVGRWVWTATPPDAV